jgi:hypothetical protein
MPMSGQINATFGVYTSVCCGDEIVIAEGARFPDCPKHPRLTTRWKSADEDPIRQAKDLWNDKKKRGDTAA